MTPSGGLVVAVVASPVCLNLSVRFISYSIVFFFYNKTASAGLSAAKTISRTEPLAGSEPCEDSGAAGDEHLICTHPNYPMVMGK